PPVPASVPPSWPVASRQATVVTALLAQVPSFTESVRVVVPTVVQVKVVRSAVEDASEPLTGFWAHEKVRASPSRSVYVAMRDSVPPMGAVAGSVVSDFTDGQLSKVPSIRTTPSPEAVGPVHWRIRWAAVSAPSIIE